MSLAPVSHTAGVAMHGLAWFGGKRLEYEAHRIDKAAFSDSRELNACPNHSTGLSPHCDPAHP